LCAELEAGAQHADSFSGQSLIDYLGTHLCVNYVRSASGGNDILLTNSGPLDIPPGARWTIYFNHYTRTLSSTLVTSHD